MGLNFNEIKYFLWARNAGVDFNKMVMIGRQRFYLNAAVMQSVFESFGIHESIETLGKILTEQNGYAEPFFKYIGAKTVDSIDASAYEGATQVVDMNQPVKEELKGRFSVVLDGGSLEHVFNFLTAIRNCMEMVQLNGHFIGITPCNNYLGHGFYQFSPELYFRIFTEANGFKMEKVILYETFPQARWYQIHDPEQIGKRLEVHTRRQTMLVIQARRTAIKPLFTTTPQQSDYAAIWQTRQSGGKLRATSEPLAMRLKMGMPVALKQVFWKLREWSQPRINSDAAQEITVPETKRSSGPARFPL